MNTLNNTTNRFTLYAAGLALSAFVIALLAVTIAAGTAQATTTDTTTMAAGTAQATTTDTTTIATSGDDNPITQQQGTPSQSATPEACPARGEAARVVDRGHYALFDVWWNPVEGELTNTVCPPSVVHVPADEDEQTPARDDRSASSIDITAEPPTIIHIPSSAKINLSDSTTYGNRTYGEVYPQVLTADNQEDRNADGEKDDGDGIVWALPACPPDGTSTSSLCLSFSAALLNPDDWLNRASEPGGVIDYLVHHVHQVDIDKQDPRYVLVYDVPVADVPATGETETGDPLWDSHDARRSTVSVAPGEYNRPLWFFTDRGTYEFQVSIQGYPNTKNIDHKSTDPSVTSDVREYIIHVGAEADLGVEMTVNPADTSDKSLDPGDDVTIEITARNNNAAGEDEAQETKVDVALPEGLTYSSHAPASDTFTKSEDVWTWNAGRMDPGASKILTITATVDAGTHGKNLGVEATISATEPVKITETVKNDKGQNEEVVKTYHVLVPDPGPTENTAAGTLTVASSANVAPMFQVTRSVPENSPAETPVGDPISVREPDAGDTLTFGITGDGADQFTASSVSGGAQIAVASGANLDYESRTSYRLVLTVSDGKDAAGNPDPSVDHTIGVLINVTDDVSEPFSVTLHVSNASPNIGESVTLSATYHNVPVAIDQLHFIFIRTTNGVETEHYAGSGQLSPISISNASAGTLTYRMSFWTWDGDKRKNEITTNTVTVTWSAPSN